VILEEGKTWAPSLRSSYYGFGDLGMDTSELAARVALAGELSDRLSSALALKDQKERAEALAPLLLSRVWEIRRTVARALPQCGEGAVAPLRSLIHRSSELGNRQYFLSILDEASHTAFLSELSKLLEEDVRFWSLAGHRREDSTGQEETDELRLRACISNYLLTRAQAAGDASAKAHADELRATFREIKARGPVANNACLPE
jgi:hypothetical protein